MCKIEEELKLLGLYLEEAEKPVGNYLNAKKVGELLFVSGRKSRLCGIVGDDVSLEQGKLAARDTILDLLAIVKDSYGELDSILGVVKLQGFFRCSADFNDLPAVLDGASDLLIQLWGEAGKHARTATGAAKLPYGAVLQLDIILAVSSQVSFRKPVGLA